MKKTLEKAAAAGRFGDDSLLHVSRAELQGLASLHPEGELPRNPKTGLPEAFFFLPFLAGIGSLFGAGTAAAAAPAAAATTAATALPAATAATLGSTLGTAALPAAAETLGATSATALPAATAMTAPTMAATLPTATAAAPSALSNAAVPALTKSFVPGGIDMVTTGSIQPALQTATTNPVTAPLFDQAAKAATTNAVTSSTLPAAPSSVAPATTANPLAPTPTPPSTIPGLNAPTPTKTLLGPVESATSSVLPKMDLSQLLQYGALGAMMMPSGGAELEDEDEVKLKNTNYHRGRPNFNFKNDGKGEHDFFPNDRYGPKKTKRKFATGGLVRGYAEGGLASLDNSSGDMSDSDLIQATRDAIIQQSPDAQPLIQMFLATFGEAALRDLLASIQMQGGGDGMSDSIPATVQGRDGSQGIAALSEGEYIIPSDVVSGIGNGSTEAGARQLDNMVANTRVARNGAPQQPPPIDPSQVMPA